MALWDYQTIIAEVRGLVMKRSSNQISNIEIGKKINQYLRFKFAQEVNPIELRDNYEFVTIDGTQEYTIDQDTVTGFEGSVFVSETDTIGDPATMWQDPSLFYLQYPTEDLTSSDEGEPTDFLYGSGKFILSPVPDAVYYIKMPCIIRPSILSNPTDVPSANGREYEEWGPVIAHGASVDILEKAGEDDRLERVMQWYQRETLLLKKRAVFQSANKRPICKF